MPRGRPKGSKNKNSDRYQEKDLGTIETFVRANDGLYHVSMKLNGTIYEKNAGVLIDALDQVDWNFHKKTLSRPVVFPTVLTVNYENNKAEIQLSPYQLRRFFYSPMYRRITEKHLNKLWRQQ